MRKDEGVIIHLGWSSNYGRAWVELLEDERLSDHARLCYVAMTSFGPKSKAGSKAIMRRMGVSSRNTLRKAQAELIACGWIRAFKPASAHEPAEWLMLAPKEAFEKFGDRASTRNKVKSPQTRHLMNGLERGEGHLMTLGGSSNDPGGGSSSDTETRIDKQEDKQERDTNAPFGAPHDGLTPRKLIAAFCEVWAEGGKRGKYPVAPKDAGQAKRLLVADATLTEQEFRQAARAYLRHSDAWTEEHGHSLSGLVANWSKWVQRARGRGRGSGMTRLGDSPFHESGRDSDDIPF